MRLIDQSSIFLNRGLANEFSILVKYRRPALVTTKTELMWCRKAAKIGLRKPNVARGVIKSEVNNQAAIFASLSQ